VRGYGKETVIQLQSGIVAIKGYMNFERVIFVLKIYPPPHYTAAGKTHVHIIINIPVFFIWSLYLMILKIEKKKIKFQKKLRVGRGGGWDLTRPSFAVVIMFKQEAVAIKVKTQQISPGF
jgi:hypothetical protein